jgi:hypothetical protein
MIDPLTKRVREVIKAYGDDAPAHFGIKKGTLDGYVKRGKYPLALIGKILAEEQQDKPEPQPEPEPPPPPRQMHPYPQGTVYNSGKEAPAPWPIDVSAATARRVEEIVRYIQGTVDVYIKQFNHRIDLLEKHVAFLRANQMRAAVGSGSLTRPDETVPVEQVFTTNPNTGFGGPIGNALDTGIAPTKEMVDAQANMTIIEGVPVRGAQLARPAQYIPEQPSFGYNWNVPRPRK